MDDESWKAHWRIGDGGRAWKEHWRIGYWRTKPGRYTGIQETEDETSIDGALEDRRRTKPGRCTGAQETEDEAWKAHRGGGQETEDETWMVHWRIGDGGQSLEGTLEDRILEKGPRKAHWRTGDRGQSQP